MLQFLKKIYRKYFKNKNVVELQNLKEEFNMLRSEVKNLTIEINKLTLGVNNLTTKIIELTTEVNKLREDNLLVSNKCDISVSNPCYFAEDDNHIYAEIMQENYEVVLSQTISGNIPPQLPPRNKINNIRF